LDCLLDSLTGLPPRADEAVDLPPVVATLDLVIRAAQAVQPAAVQRVEVWLPA